MKGFAKEGGKLFALALQWCCCMTVPAARLVLPAHKAATVLSATATALDCSRSAEDFGTAGQTARGWTQLR